MPRSSSGLLRVLRINSSTVSGPSDFGRPPIAASFTSRKTQYSPFGRTPANAAHGHKGGGPRRRGGAGAGKNRRRRFNEETDEALDLEKAVFCRDRRNRIE